VTTIQGPNSAVPGASIPYSILILNRGTIDAASLAVTLTVSNAASLSVPGGRCTAAGNTRTCTFGSASLMRGFAFRKSVQVVAQGAPGTLTLSARASSSNGELNPANDSYPLSVQVEPLPMALAVAAPQNTDNLVCGSSQPLSFADCVAAPSSYVPSKFTLYPDNTVGGLGAAGRVGTWSQPTPTSLELVMTSPSQAVFQGSLSAPSCFRGTISFPGRASPWYGAFQLCLTP